MHARDTHVPHALSTTKPGGPLGELVVVVATRLHGQGQRLTCLTTSGPKCPSRFRCQLTQAAMPARSCPTCRNHPHSGTSSPYGWHASTRTRRASSPPLHPLTNNRASIQLSCPRQRSVEDSRGLQGRIGAFEGVVAHHLPRAEIRLISIPARTNFRPAPPGTKKPGRSRVFIHYR